jgi:hypothetical protein
VVTSQVTLPSTLRRDALQPAKVCAFFGMDMNGLTDHSHLADFVDNNPAALANAYFQFNSINIYL